MLWFGVPVEIWAAAAVLLAAVISGVFGLLASRERGSAATPTESSLAANTGSHAGEPSTVVGLEANREGDIDYRRLLDRLGHVAPDIEYLAKLDNDQVAQRWPEVDEAIMTIVRLVRADASQPSAEIVKLHDARVKMEGAARDYSANGDVAPLLEAFEGTRKQLRSMIVSKLTLRDVARLPESQRAAVMRERKER